MPTFECRLAKIEQKLADNDVAIVERRRQEDKMLDKLVKIEDKLNSMRDFTVGVAAKLNSMRDFTAGVAAAFTCIGGLIVFLWDKVLKAH